MMRFINSIVLSSLNMFSSQYYRDIYHSPQNYLMDEILSQSTLTDLDKDFIRRYPSSPESIRLLQNVLDFLESKIVYHVYRLENTLTFGFFCITEIEFFEKFCQLTTEQKLDNIPNIIDKVTAMY